MKEQFWLVWCPAGASPPRHRHRSREAAQEEAERLARSAPRSEFYVMAAVSCSTKLDVLTVSLDGQPIENEIPF